MKISNTLRWSALGAGAAIALSLLSGCSQGASNVAAHSQVVTGLQGKAYGGQQPIAGAAIQLWGVGTSGYGSAATPLLTATVTTSDGSGSGGNAGNGFNTYSRGSFNITGDYTCPASDLVYITAVGGMPDLTHTNSNLVIMSALGSCSYLQANAASVFININEVSTVASVWALLRFMNSYSSIGAPSSNLSGLTRAFGLVNELVDTSTGIVSGPALPAGATIPSAELNTLANVMATCVNSAGGAANDGTNCGKLFSYSSTASNVPTDTVGAALNIARNPATNVASIFNLTVGNAEFSPALSASPGNWMISINYTGAGLSAPKSIAVDNSGSIWLANFSANTISALSSAGVAISNSTGYTASGNLNGPSSIAIDLAGNPWVANKVENNVIKLDASGNYVGTYTGSSTISTPTSLAIDGLGGVWIANAGNNSVTALNNSGAFVGNYTPAAGVSAPTTIAINAH